MKITTTQTKTTEIEYNIDVSKLDTDEVDELFTELSEIVTQDCFDDMLTNNSDFLMKVIASGHPYIKNKDVVIMAEFIDTELNDKERKEILKYLKSKYPMILEYFES